MQRFFSTSFLSVLSLILLPLSGPALAAQTEPVANIVGSTPVFAGSYSATPTQAGVGQAVTLNATITDRSGKLSNGNVTLEVYDAANHKIFQNYFSGQSFRLGQHRSYSAVWTPTLAGSFTYQLGVFDSTWSTAYLWAIAANITVNGPPPPPPGSGLSVSGNTLRDSNNNIVVLRGVNRAGTDYACIQGWGIFDTTINVLNDDVEIPLMRSWGANTVTVGLNEDCWLNINMGTSPYGGATYINAIKHYVATIEANNMFPVLALFMIAPGTTQAQNQNSMPDNDHAPAFWQSVANTFKGDPKVIFRVQEEPRPRGNTDDTAAWTCWRQGDRQYDTSNTLVPVSSTVNCSEGFVAVGMQSLVNIIRGTGARNIIALPGTSYSNSMTHFLDAGIRITDTLNPPQLIAAVDNYPFNPGCSDSTCWNAKYAPVIAVMPFWAGEIGEDIDGAVYTTTHVDALMAWLDSHGAGYSAWVWNTWGGSLQMITAYGTGTPKSP
jgi:endoglucanase